MINHDILGAFTLGYVFGVSVVTLYIIWKMRKEKWSEDE